jgi:hypothetical protein
MKTWPEHQVGGAEQDMDAAAAKGQERNGCRIPMISAKPVRFDEADCGMRRAGDDVALWPVREDGAKHLHQQTAGRGYTR